MASLFACSTLKATKYVVSSGEAKALETAEPIANHFGCALIVDHDMHENDRTATGFLPPEEFEKVADLFFAHPQTSIRGWERAIDAQRRIVGRVAYHLDHCKDGDILFVGHGGVGTLLMCAIANFKIHRRFDQLSGGGCFFIFAIETKQLLAQWQILERM